MKIMNRRMTNCLIGKMMKSYGLMNGTAIIFHCDESFAWIWVIEEARGKAGEVVRGICGEGSLAKDIKDMNHVGILLKLCLIVQDWCDLLLMA